jgi:MFS family permease
VTGVTARLGVLAERPFRLLFLARASSVVGDALIPVALAFAVLEVGGGASGLGVVLAAFTLARVALILAGGVWADRLPRRSVLIGCDVVRGLVDAFTAVALLTGVMELWMFVVTASLFGAASAFFGPASTALVPATVSGERLQQANALLALTRRGADVFGPLLAGAIVVAAAPGWVFAIDAGTFAVSAFFLLRLRVDDRPTGRRSSFLGEAADGWREVRSRRWLGAGFVAFALGNLGVAAFPVLGPTIAARELGGAHAWGLIVAGGAIGGIAGGIGAYRWLPRRPLLVCFLVFPLASLPLLALAPPLPVLVIVAANAAFLFGISFGNAIWETVLQQRIPGDQLGRVSSYDWMVSLVFMPIGYVLAGPLADAIGLEATLVGAAALIVAVDVSALLLVPELRSMRALPRGTRPSETAAPRAPEPAVTTGA